MRADEETKAMRTTLTPGLHAENRSCLMPRLLHKRCTVENHSGCLIAFVFFFASTESCVCRHARYMPNQTTRTDELTLALENMLSQYATNRLAIDEPMQPLGSVPHRLHIRQLDHDRIRPLLVVQ
jgi:hypothetical protein